MRSPPDRVRGCKVRDQELHTFGGSVLSTLAKTLFNPRVFTIQYVLPVRILMQIVAMSFSVNHEDSRR
jgi:hypothetical protein